MRKLLFIALLAGCASSSQSNGPDVQIALAQLNNPTDFYYFAGPVSVQYQLAVTNNTNEPVKLKRLDLATSGEGAYFLRTSGSFNVTVPPKSTVNQTFSAWGRSRGSYLSMGEPVTLRVNAVFADPANHSFSKMALENLPQG
jgi:hypothetical protein